MTKSYVRSAYEKLCADAEKAEGRYVSLYTRQQCYGGPEEGGWWYDVWILESTAYVPTLDTADKLKAAIEKDAEEMTIQARASYGEYCKREMEWLDERGLDADYLPEPDGPEEYHVLIEEHPGQSETTVKPIWQ